MIFYFDLPKNFLNIYFFQFLKIIHNLSDLNYSSNEKKIIDLKKISKFFGNFIKILKKKYRIKLIISFGFILLKIAFCF